MPTLSGAQKGPHALEEFGWKYARHVADMEAQKVARLQQIHGRNVSTDGCVLRHLSNLAA